MVTMNKPEEHLDWNFKQSSTPKQVNLKIKEHYAKHFMPNRYYSNMPIRISRTTNTGYKVICIQLVNSLV